MHGREAGDFRFVRARSLGHPSIEPVKTAGYSRYIFLSRCCKRE